MQELRKHNASAACGELIMSEIYKSVETGIGVISGRDAIYLDEIKFDYSKNSVQLIGEINGRLCSRNSLNLEWIKYSIIFSNILMFQMIELDFADFKGSSSFDEVVNSTWFEDVRKYDSASKINDSHKYYFFKTYDDIFEIVCKNYQLTLQS